MNLAITNEEHFFRIVGITPEIFSHLKDNQAKFYRPFIKKELKSDGRIKERPVCPSIGLLLEVQTRINEKILSNFHLPDFIVGGVKGNDSISNSKTHVGKDFHLSVDIENFFPSVSYERVNRTLLKLGFHPKVSGMISFLTTYRGHVPQGIPTSTAICNLVLLHTIDRKIEKVIEGSGITYTRYVDDINFSSQADFLPESLKIIKTIAESGFKINRRKTFYKKGPIEMTGSLVCNNGLKTLRKHLDKLSEPNRSERSKAGIRNYIRRQKSK